MVFIDIDECKDEDICKEGTYCLNLQGSHKCNGEPTPLNTVTKKKKKHPLLHPLLACDKACDKICNGPGPSKCAECAKGYARDRAGVCKGKLDNTKNYTKWSHDCFVTNIYKSVLQMRMSVKMAHHVQQEPIARTGRENTFAKVC